MKPMKILIVMALTLAPGIVSAATCGDRAHVVGQLETRFGETLIANAVSADNAVMEVYASEKVASWTILVTLPGGKNTCLAASGKGAKSLKGHIADHSYLAGKL